MSVGSLSWCGHPFFGAFKYVVLLWRGLNIFSSLLPILAIEFPGYVIISCANCLTYYFVIEFLRNKCAVKFSQFELLQLVKDTEKCVFDFSD